MKFTHKRPKQYAEHGGAHSYKKRKSKRRFTTNQSLHVTLRSEFAKKNRSLLKHKAHINYVIQKACRLFEVKVYEKAICGNHIHLLIHGKRRENIQNFFRVVAGHIAQEILKQFPITEAERALVESAGNAPMISGMPPKREHNAVNKYKRKFWALLIYSRSVTWGREFKKVSQYIIQNILESLNIIAYKPRNTS